MLDAETTRSVPVTVDRSPEKPGEVVQLRAHVAQLRALVEAAMRVLRVRVDATGEYSFMTGDRECAARLGVLQTFSHEVARSIESERGFARFIAVSMVDSLFRARAGSYGPATAADCDRRELAEDTTTPDNDDTRDADDVEVRARRVFVPIEVIERLCRKAGLVPDDGRVVWANPSTGGGAIGVVAEVRAPSLPWVRPQAVDVVRLPGVTVGA